jgi:hypothetical protein
MGWAGAVIRLALQFQGLIARLNETSHRSLSFVGA